MKLSICCIFPWLLVASAIARSNEYKYEKLDKDKALLLIIDMQEGLYSLVRDFDPTVFRDSLIAHASLGKMFDLPVVMTTSAEVGPNGRLPQEITDMYPDAPLIRRGGEVDAWDSAAFVEAVKATNRTQIIIGGIVTEVCTTFLALSLREAGYSVWANAEASGTMSLLSREMGNLRMINAGVQVVSWFAIVGELMRDWRNVPGGKELWPYLDRFMPAGGMVARAHRTAIENGTIVPGVDTLPL